MAPCCPCWSGVALIAAGTWAIGRSRRLSISLTPIDATLTRFFTSTVVRWEDVAAVRFDRVQDRRGAFPYGMYVLPVATRKYLTARSPWLDKVDAAIAARYIAEHVPSVVVNPKEPWLDRDNVWHGDYHEFDPEESIRSIRRAAVGKNQIRVTVKDGGYRAITLGWSGEPVRESETFPTLGEATEAAIAQIHIAQSEEAERLEFRHDERRG